VSGAKVHGGGVRHGSTVYDETMAAGFDRGRRLRAEDVDAWMAAARPYLPGAGGRVLDLGAGTGRFSVALAGAAGAMVIACEPSAAMRAVCRANCPGVPVVGARAQALPFDGQVFDAVWASQVIHHIDDVAAFAVGLRRVLKPGGHLLLRGGFGPPDELPLYRYFPEAWATGTVVTLPLSEIGGILASAGIDLCAHATVEQVLAESPAELVDRVRTRSLSNLAGLADAVFENGLDALRRDAREGRIPQRVVERLDLVVFR
jgi:ubiquinone/menaquinone biosynthesis C-methylase UbiE